MRRYLIVFGVVFVLVVLAALVADWRASDDGDARAQLPYGYVVPPGARLVGVPFPVVPPNARGDAGTFYVAVSPSSKISMTSSGTFFDRHPETARTSPPRLDEASATATPSPRRGAAATSSVSLRRSKTIQ